MMNYWDGYDNKSMWQGIRNCNIFLENINRPVDLEPYVKERWVAEAKFLKAYFHWFLLRMYGPIPIMDKNLPISRSEEHTSELQSLMRISYAVFCLKKKKNHNNL